MARNTPFLFPIQAIFHTILGTSVPVVFPPWRPTSSFSAAVFLSTSPCFMSGLTSLPVSQQPLLTLVTDL